MSAQSRGRRPPLPKIGSSHSHPACLFALTGLALSLTWTLERPGATPLLLSHGGDQYGPRFHFKTLLSMTILIGLGLERLSRARMAWVVIATIAVCTVASNAVLGLTAYEHIHARRDVYRVIERAQIEHAIVLLKTASADMVRLDLNRSPPDFRHA